MTLAEDLAKFIKNTDYSSIPEKVRELAKDQLMGILGAIYAGSKTEASEILKKVSINDLDNLTGKKEFTIIPTGEKTNFYNAIMVNEGNAIALDYDDYLFFGHTGVSTVPLPLALSEYLDISGKDLITLIVIGNEVGGRVGASILLGPQNGQLWSYIHLASSAAITAKALDLSVDEIANALGIAMYCSTNSLYRGFMGPMTKYLTTSIPTKIGVEAAFLAKNGFTGALDIFESPLGWCNFTADIPIPSFINSSLGKAWVTETIAFKMAPGCAYVSPIADCMMEIFKQAPNLDYKQIKEVRVYASMLMSAMDDLSRPFTNLEELKRVKTHVALNFYIPYNIAVMLIDKELTARQFEENRYLDEEVHKLSKKIRTLSDMSFTTETVSLISGLGSEIAIDQFKIYFKEEQMEKLDMAFGAKVVIELNDGTIYKAHVPSPSGSPANRVPIEPKLRREGNYIGMSNSQINDIINNIRNLENISNVKDLIPQLCLK
ncbi:MAG: MmgE/PrpD family protein [Promethearchaeota archaeon]